MADLYHSAGAEFDDARVYRYRLWRIWGGGSRARWRTVLWIMLNPSTANEHVLDPTLRRCERFSRDWGYNGFEVCNLFAFRSTDPSELTPHYGGLTDAALRETNRRNLDTIHRASEQAAIVVCGWGNEKIAQPRGRELLEQLGQLKKPVFCLGRNANGSPKHPLYLAASTTLIPVLS